MYITTHWWQSDSALLCCIIFIGYPNDFNAFCSWKIPLLLFCWKQPIIKQTLENVMKTMNKQDCNNFIIQLPAWLLQFVPHIFLTLQHILVKERKKDQLTFNMAEQPIALFHCYNQLPDTHLKVKNLIFWWQYCNACQWCKIVLPTIQAPSRCHEHLLFVIRSILFLQCRLVFGSNFSPANWKPIWCIVEQLATAYFDDVSLQAKHKHHLDKLQWDASLCNHKQQFFTPATKYVQCNGVLWPNQSMMPK